PGRAHRRLRRARRGMGARLRRPHPDRQAEAPFRHHPLRRPDRLPLHLSAEAAPTRPSPTEAAVRGKVERAAFGIYTYARSSFRPASEPRVATVRFHDAAARCPYSLAVNPARVRGVIVRSEVTAPKRGTSRS